MLKTPIFLSSWKPSHVQPAEKTQCDFPFRNPEKSAVLLLFFTATGRYDFDLFTIGGGSGGVRGSRWAAQQYGAKAGRIFPPGVSNQWGNDG